jgi:hypothetical protein
MSQLPAEPVQVWQLGTVLQPGLVTQPRQVLQLLQQLKHS